jgi:hypothetical protein
MPVSQYFNNYNAKYTEQRLVEDLIIESIKIQGFDAYYLPNDNDAARDLLYGEDPTKRFTNAFPLEMYLSNATDYNGEREMFSKFGLEIKNQVSVIVSKRTFSQRVPQTLFTRPREGDLIYVPFLNGTGELYEIKFTNQNKDFFMLGRKAPYFYELELEKFKYSQEVITTGISDIDQVVADSGYTLHLTTGVGTGEYSITEIVYQTNDGTYANGFSFGSVQDWDQASNTLSITNIAGEFVDGSVIIGSVSNAQYYLSTFDPLNESMVKESYDNETIQTEATLIVNTSEQNPFGGI